jgi:hypothetical protein
MGTNNGDRFIFSLTEFRASILMPIFPFAIILPIVFNPFILTLQSCDFKEKRLPENGRICGHALPID